MDGIGLEEIAATAPVSITVLSVTAMEALCDRSVELAIDGVPIGRGTISCV